MVAMCNFNEAYSVIALYLGGTKLMRRGYFADAMLRV